MEGDDGERVGAGASTRGPKRRSGALRRRGLRADIDMRWARLLMRDSLSRCNAMFDAVYV